MRFCIASSMTWLALHLHVDSAGVQLDDGVHGVAGMSVRTDWDTTKYQGNLLSFAVFSQPKVILQYVTITGTRIKIHLHFV